MNAIRSALGVAAAVSAALLSGAAPAAGAKLELVQRASYPALYSEGPVLFGNRLLLAEMDAGQVSELTEEGLKPFWKRNGCGPTSVAPLAGDRVVVLCHSGGYLAIVSAKGELVDRIEADGAGNKLVDPNDCISDGAGGVYFSDSGLFDPRAEATGAVFYLSPDLKLTRVLSDIHYSNGVAVHQPSHTLLVSEHLGHRLLAFKIEGPGKLGKQRVVLDEAAIRKAAGLTTSVSGPDGIEIFDADSALVCIYGDGTIIHFSLSGKVLDVFRVDLKYVTNVARTGERLVVTGAYEIATWPRAGAVEVFDVKR
jgi:sugar lactone lactonase YvrE